jgi:hypothetical protein
MHVPAREAEQSGGYADEVRGRSIKIDSHIPYYF